MSENRQQVNYRDYIYDRNKSEEVSQAIDFFRQGYDAGDMAAARCLVEALNCRITSHKECIRHCEDSISRDNRERLERTKLDAEGKIRGGWSVRDAWDAAERHEKKYYFFTDDNIEAYRGSIANCRKIIDECEILRSTVVKDINAGLLQSNADSVKTSEGTIDKAQIASQMESMQIDETHETNETASPVSHPLYDAVSDLDQFVASFRSKLRQNDKAKQQCDGKFARQKNDAKKQHDEAKAEIESELRTAQAVIDGYLKEKKQQLDSAITKIDENVRSYRDKGLAAITGKWEKQSNLIGKESIDKSAALDSEWNDVQSKMVPMINSLTEKIRSAGCTDHNWKARGMTPMWRGIWLFGFFFPPLQYTCYVFFRFSFGCMLVAAFSLRVLQACKTVV